MDSEVVEELFEGLSGEALVGQDDLAGGDEVVVDLEQGLHDLAFVEFGVGQAPHDRHALDGGHEVEAHTPEVAGVGGAVAVTGFTCQVRALHGRTGASALHRGGIDQPQLVHAGRGDHSEGADQAGDQRPGRTQPLVPTRLLRQIREHAGEVLAGIPQPRRFGRAVEQDLRHGQTYQLSIGELFGPAGLPRGDQHVV